MLPIKLPNHAIERLEYSICAKCATCAAQVPGHIIDITKELHAGTLHWDSPTGLGEFRERYTRIEDGDLANQSLLKDFPVHVATHVDAPSHFSHEHFETGKGVEELDLYILNGTSYPLSTSNNSHSSNIG